MTDSDSSDPETASSSESDLTKQPAAAEPVPAPGSYWARHEIVRRGADEVRRGAAPVYVRRIEEHEPAAPE